MATVPAPPELSPKSSFSSVQGWDFYRAVHEAVHADEGSSAARLRNGPTSLPTQVQVPRNEDGPRREEAAASVGPVDQASGHEDSQRDWEAEQDWLQEVADSCHEVGPWADLVG